MISPLILLGPFLLQTTTLLVFVSQTTETCGSLVMVVLVLLKCRSLRLTGTTTVSLCFNREYCPVVSLPLVQLVEQLIMPVQFACGMKFMIKPLPLKEAVVLTLVKTVTFGSKIHFWVLILIRHSTWVVHLPVWEWKHFHSVRLSRLLVSVMVTLWDSVFLSSVSCTRHLLVSWNCTPHSSFPSALILEKVTTATTFKSSPLISEEYLPLLSMVE